MAAHDEGCIPPSIIIRQDVAVAYLKPLSDMRYAQAWWWTFVFLVHTVALTGDASLLTHNLSITFLSPLMASVGRAGYLLRKPRLHPSRGFYFSLFVPAIDQHRVGRTVVQTSLS